MRPQVVFDIAGLAERRPEVSTSVALLVDAAVAEAPVTRRLRAELARAGARPEPVVLHGPGDRASLAELADLLVGAGPVVAVGGGSLMDRAKLAAVRADAPASARYLDTAQRSGLILLPPAIARTRLLVAIPTTLGTGAEVSRSACLAGPYGRQLVVGESLRPDLAVLVPEASDGLPAHLVMEGVLEALFRTVSPYIGDGHDRHEADELAEHVAGRLVRLGERICGELRTGVRPDRRALVEIARLGGLSHLDEMHGGRDPFAARGWYLANELSVALGLRKTQAVAALLPHLWRAIALGDARLGSAPRLRRMWQAIRRVAGRPLPDDPVPGVVRLLDAWGVRRALAPGDDDRVALAARRAVRSWGGGLPMLAGLRRGEIHTLLARAAAGLPA